MSYILHGALRSVQTFDRKGSEDSVQVPQTYIFNSDGSALFSVSDSRTMLSMRWKISKGRLHLKAVGSKGQWSFFNFEMRKPDILVLNFKDGRSVFQKVSKDMVSPWWTVRFAKRCKLLDY
jgi:hypothetical protein